MRTIKVGSDFSGVGAFNQALLRLNIPHEEIFACDMDKYARQTFIANYGEPKYYPMNVYDREIPEESLDIYMTSPPCQAFSLAGKRLGKDDKRGILFFNSHEFIQKNKPRYFIFENVKGLLSDDGGKTFQEWVNMLGGKSVNGLPVLFPYEDSVPYHLYWKVLNAKNYGVPQNRERVFLIGIRDDSDNTFTWPKEETLQKRLKDVLEEEILQKFYLSDAAIQKCLKSEANKDMLIKEVSDVSKCIVAGYYKIPFDGQYIKVESNLEKYFLSEKMIDGFLNHNDIHNEKGTGFIFKPKNENEIANCIRANAGLCPTDNTLKIKSESKKHLDPEMIIPLFHYGNGKSNERMVYDKNGISPCMTSAMGTGGGYIPAIEIGDFRTDEGFRWREDGNSPCIMASMRDKWSEKFTAQNPPIVKYNIKRLNETLKKHQLPTGEVRFVDSYNQSIHENSACINARINATNDRHLWDGYRIRRLTPRECFRLMDFPDTFTWPVSDSQAYKQAGNSIVVGVLEKIVSKFKLD